MTSPGIEPEPSDSGTILKVGGPKSIQFFHLQRITRSYELTVIFVVLALARPTADTACRKRLPEQRCSF